MLASSVVDAFQYLKGAIRRLEQRLRNLQQQQGFQYLKGAIRSRPRAGAERLRLPLSIPQRCD